MNRIKDESKAMFVFMNVRNDSISKVMARKFVEAFQFFTISFSGMIFYFNQCITLRMFQYEGGVTEGLFPHEKNCLNFCFQEFKKE